MSAFSTRPPAQSVSSGEPRRVGAVSVLALQVFLVVLGVAALVAGPQVPAAYEETARIVAPAAPAAALVLGVAMWLSKLVGRRNRSRTKETLAWIEGLHVCAAPLEARAVPAPTPAPVRPEEDGASPVVSRRVLELQVRSLETALEEQQQRTEDVRLTVEGQFAVAGRRDQERAVLTVQALRGVLTDRRGVEAANRVEAALNRMGAAPSFARPVLAATPSGSPAVALRSMRPVPPLDRAPVVQAPVAQGPVESPVAQAPVEQAPVAQAPVEQTPVAQAPVESPEAQAPVEQPEAEQPAEKLPEPPAAPAGPRPVLPVPPPRVTAPAPRKGRRLRRTVVAV